MVQKEKRIKGGAMKVGVGERTQNVMDIVLPNRPKA
jgi:hypothetical protein